MKYTLNDIPNDIVNKQFFPLARHFYRALKELGWGYISKNYDKLVELVYNELSARFDESIVIANKVIKGKIENPDKIIIQHMNPPTLIIKSDLLQGTTKLIYGDSIDIAFSCISDIDKEILFIFNCHVENGLPTSYFWIPNDDETLNTRHFKMGVKLRDIPKKLNFSEAGFRTIDILKKIRNEITPEHSASEFVVCNYFNIGGINTAAELSNWIGCSTLWDGINTKSYGLPEHCFWYVPWPSLIKSLLELPRNIWNTRMTSLFTKNLLYLGYVINHNDFRSDLPESFDLVIRHQLAEGIPTPRQTLQCEPPNLKEKIYEFTYPEGKRITPEDLNLTGDDFLNGVLTDITHETTQDVFSRENIISLGHGEHTKILK
ncbi:MAG: hypothetical protein ACFFD2_29810 [Promethearchaeota archaeon]